MTKDDIALFAEESEDRVEAVRSQSLPDVLQWVATVTAEADKTITEAGLFNNDTAGSLFIHGDFTGIVLSTGDKIELTFQLEVQ